MFFLLWKVNQLDTKVLCTAPRRENRVTVPSICVGNACIHSILLKCQEIFCLRQVWQQSEQQLQCPGRKYSMFSFLWQFSCCGWHGDNRLISPVSHSAFQKAQYLQGFQLRWGLLHAPYTAETLKAQSNP